MTACGGISITLGARLGHLAARLAHSGGCGIRHQPCVAENRAELVSLAETSNGRLGSIGMHAREEMEKLFDTGVHLELFVKVTPGWREKGIFLNAIDWRTMTGKDDA